MGGYGTYKFATQYPDLFARANPVVGPPGLGVWVPPGAAAARRRGEQHEPDARLGAEHPVPDLGRRRGRARPGGGRGRPGADLRRSRLPLHLRPVHDRRPLHARDRRSVRAGRGVPRRPRRCDRNPPHVSYVVNPTMDFAGAGTRRRPRLLAVRTAAPRFDRERAAGQRSTRARRDSAAPIPSPKPTRTVPSNLLQGGNLPPLNYSERQKTWGPERTVPKGERAAPRRPQPGPRRGAPGAGAPELPREARRDHGRARSP